MTLAMRRLRQEELQLVPGKTLSKTSNQANKQIKHLKVEGRKTKQSEVSNVPRLA